MQIRKWVYNRLAYLGFHYVPTLLRVELEAEAPQLRERVVEWPFVLSNLDLEHKGRILDVGCTDPYNPIPATLAGLGHEVHGIDGREFKLKYPNFTFHKGDIRQTTFSDNFFDLVIAVSTIEHIGVPKIYGSDEDLEGDKKAMREILRILKPGGKLLVTLPYGKAMMRKLRERRYDHDKLQDLFRGLVVEKAEYYGHNEDGYLERVPEEKAGIYDFKSRPTFTNIACLKLVKRPD